MLGLRTRGDPFRHRDPAAMLRNRSPWAGFGASAVFAPCNKGTLARAIHPVTQVAGVLGDPRRR